MHDQFLAASRLPVEEQHADEICRFLGALAFNALAFLLPASLTTLSKTWLPRTDSSHIGTSNEFQCLDFTSKLLNEGVPRAAWIVIGDTASRTYSERLRLTHTLMLFQLVISFVVFLLFSMLADLFVTPGLSDENHGRTLAYVRLIAGSMIPSAVETALVISSRALDRPDIPLVISFTNYILNIILGVHLGAILPAEKWGANADLTTQTELTLLCNILSLLAGLAYYVYSAIFRSHNLLSTSRLRPGLASLSALWQPGMNTLLESLLRNLLSIFATSSIGSMRLLHASSWLIFTDLRWGLLMAPTRAFEAAALTHVAHNWSQLHAQAGLAAERVRISWGRVRLITQPARAAIALNIALEVPVSIFMGVWAMQHYASWSASNTSDIAQVAGQMWRASGWAYLCYVMSLPVGAVLLASKPRWWLSASLGPQILWVLPWALACSGRKIDQMKARWYYESVFEGTLVVTSVCVMVGMVLWVRSIRRGSMRFDRFRKV